MRCTGKRTRKSAGANRQSGFSLLEVLISLALLVAIMVGLGASLGLGVRINERTTDLMAQDAGPILRGRLRGWIARAEPTNPFLPFETGFYGTQESFRVVTLDRPPMVAGAIAARVTVTLDDEGLFFETAMLGERSTVLSTERRRLAPALDGLAFSYFDAGATPPTWRDTWRGRSDLPLLVRIRSDAPELWPDFTVRLVLSRDL